MGNFFCNPHEAAHLGAVARDFCPFPDYSPSPLLNILQANSSLPLSEHYATVQASLTQQQQHDFTRSLRNTFGREGKVSHGGMGIVALSLAVLFDTVAREVKGEHVSYQEPIPGLFLKDPRGTYSPPIYTVSKYLRLVPYIANNPTRMSDETEKFLHKLNHDAQTMEKETSAQNTDDVVGLNLMFNLMMVKSMVVYHQNISNKTIDLKNIEPSNTHGSNPDLTFLLNCDPKEAGERFMTQLDSLGDQTKQAYENCGLSSEKETVIQSISTVEWTKVGMSTMFSFLDKNVPDQKEDFDLKPGALGKWA